MLRLFYLLIFVFVSLTVLAQDSTLLEHDYVIEQLKSKKHKEQIAILYQEYKSRMDSEPQLSEEILNVILRISIEHNDTTEMALALYNLGKSTRKHGKSTEAINYMYRSKLLYKKLNNNNRVADCLNELGIANKNIGHYEKALNIYFEALNIAELNNYSQGKIKVISNIAVIFMFQNNNAKAIEYLKKSLVLEKDKTKKSAIYNNLGLTYQTINKNDIALTYYKKSIESAKLTEDIYAQSFPLNNIGLLYLKSKNYNKALEYFLQVEKIEVETGNKKGLIGTYINIALLKKYNAQYKEAVAILLKADSLAIETKSLYEQYAINVNLALTYQDWGKYKESIDFLHHSIALKDSLFNENKSRQIAELTSKYEADKKQKQIELLERDKKLKALAFQKQQSDFVFKQLKTKSLADRKQVELRALKNGNKIQQLTLQNNKNEIERLNTNALLNKIDIQRQQSKVKRESFIRNIALLISLLIAIPAIVLLIFYQQKVKAQSIVSIRNEQLNQKQTLELINDYEIKTIKAQLEGQEIEKKRIASDLHDGIGGNLASIKLGLNKLDDQLGGNNAIKQIMAQVNGTYEEIRTISHNLTPTKILNTTYVKLIKEYVFKTLNETSLTPHFQAHPKSKLNHLSNEIKIEIYRIIQELLSNAIRHSKATSLDISLNLNEESLILMIEDTGIGFDTKKEVNGIGLLSIESRVSSINGKLTVDSIIGRGSIFTVEIPLNLKTAT